MPNKCPDPPKNKFKKVVKNIQKVKLVIDNLGIPKAPELPFKLPEIPSYDEMVQLEKTKKEQLKKIKEAEEKLK